MLITASEVVARSGEAAKSGPMGFAIVLVLGVACYFLFKSMSKHMRRVREQFPTQGAKRPPDGAKRPPEVAEPPSSGAETASVDRQDPARRGGDQLP